MIDKPIYGPAAAAERLRCYGKMTMKAVFLIGSNIAQADKSRSGSLPLQKPVSTRRREQQREFFEAPE